MADPFETLTLEQLRSRTSAKWRTYPPDVLPLWVAEMDVELAPAVVEAVCEAMRSGDTGYANAQLYVDAFADFAVRRWGWRFDGEATALVPDVMLGVVEVLELVTRPGDAVVVNAPVYPPFYQFLSSSHRRVVEAPLDARYRIDLPALERVLDRARPTAYLLCSPHNPTGTVHTRAELEAVAALTAASGVRVVVDEIHAPLVYADARHVPYLSLPEAADGFALASASKGWNLAGLKAALVVAGETAAADLARMPEQVWHGASHVGVLAHAAAFRHGEGWLDAVLAALDRNRRLLADLLARELPGVGYRQPQATYLAWLDCRALRLPGDPATVFLDRAKVALSSGPSFGTGGEGHARLNLATAPSILTEAVRRLRTAVAAGTPAG